MTTNTPLKYIEYGLVTLCLAMPLTGCSKNEQQTEEQKQQKLKQDEEYKLKVQEQQRLHALKIEAYNKSKQEWESQKLEGRILEFDNLDGTKDYKYPVREVLSNTDGWSFIFKNPETNELHEYRLYRGSRNTDVRLLEDLSQEQEPYAEIKNFYNSAWNGKHYNATIHIRSKDKIMGGDEVQTLPRGHTRHHKRTSIEINDSKEK